MALCWVGLVVDVAACRNKKSVHTQKKKETAEKTKKTKETDDEYVKLLLRTRTNG